MKKRKAEMFYAPFKAASKMLASSMLTSTNSEFSPSLDTKATPFSLPTEEKKNAKLHN